jgi:hypothetical protein
MAHGRLPSLQAITSIGGKPAGNDKTKRTLAGTLSLLSDARTKLTALFNATVRGWRLGGR